MADATETKPETAAPEAPKPDARQTAMPFVQTPTATPPGANPATGVTIPSQMFSELERVRREADAAAAELRKRDAAAEETKALLAQLQEKVALSEKEKVALADGRKADRIRADAKAAAVKHGAVSEDQLLKLILDELDAGPDGATVAKSDAKVGVDAFVAKYLKENPHLAKSAVRGGGGASPFPGAPPAGQQAAYDMTTAEGLTQFARSLTYRQAPQKAA